MHVGEAITSTQPARRSACCRQVASGQLTLIVGIAASATEARGDDLVGNVPDSSTSVFTSRGQTQDPGYVRTEMTERTVSKIVQRTARTSEEAEEMLARMAPLGRLIEADEVADAVAYLASPGAAAINGQSIVIDGGGVQA